jgi:AraC-like DNA-binding protein
MTSSRFNYGIILHRGTRVRSVNILLKEEWMRKYFSQYDVNFWLKYLHTLRLNGVNRVPIDFYARKSLFDLLEYPIDNPGYMIFAQTRIFELIDDYANQILRLKNNNQQEEILFIDVAKIIELDVLINSKIEQQAALPSIDEMATIANMSASKLKALFKKMYNQSISDYFNTCRLSTAKKVLLQQQTSIKELSNQFGYKSVQHFTTAFKKQFGETPATLLKREIA